MRQSTADQKNRYLHAWAAACLRSSIRPQGHDERSSAFAHLPQPRRHRPVRRRMHATRPAAWPRRSHRRRRGRTAPSLNHRPRARRVLLIACKTRRASRCPPCAEVYRADTYQLSRAGLTGGKGVPETVADHPCVFTTLTAPSFGPVHVQREKDGVFCGAVPADTAEPVPMAAACPAPPGTLAMTRGSANRCVLTTTTTPARYCSTPALPGCGADSPSPCAGHSPARPESAARPSPHRSR
jgi:hypothetical protein